MNIKVLLCFFLIFQAIFLFGKLNEQPKIHLSILEDTSASLNTTTIHKLYLQHKFKKLPEFSFNAGYTESIFWIAAESENLPSHNEWLLTFDSPHINILTCYLVDVNGNIKLLYKTGDFLPFKQRPFPEFTTYAMPLKDSSSIYLFKVDKRKESLQIPMRILTYKELSETYIKTNLINGLLSGIIIMMIFFSLVLWISTHKILYLCYGLYIGTLLLWIWSNKGLGFEYLWPNSEFFPSRARPTTLLLNLIFNIQFMQLFIGQTKKSYLYNFAKIIQAACIVFLVAVLWPIEYEKSVITFKKAQLFITILASAQLIYIITSLAEKIWKGVREAKFYLFAFLVLAVSGLAEQFYFYGIINLNYYVAQFALLGGLVIEASILTYGLARKFNIYRKERETLLFEKNQQQKILTNTIVTVQEKERKIFADRLHDEIGSMLSVIGIHLNTLRNNISILKNDAQGKLEQAEEVLSQVATTVRTMSHQISPVEIDKLGFVKALESLVQTVNKTEKLYIEFVCIGFKETSNYPNNYLNSVYRIIQELLQNMIKHSEASNGIIQLIEHEDIIIIMAEDNGKGLTAERLDNPLGSNMSSIKSKVAYLQGTMAIDTPEKGTLINIEIPNQINGQNEQY